MKKKSLFLVGLLFTNFVIFANPPVNYEVTTTTNLLKNPYNDAPILMTLQKGDILSNNKNHQVDEDERTNTYYIKLKYGEKNGRINIENIKILNSETADEKLKNKNWVAKYAVDALYEKNINIVFENEGNWPEYAATHPTDLGSIWAWQEYMQVPILRVSNVDINIIFSLDHYSGLFTQINNNEYVSYSYSIWNYVHGKYLDNLCENEKYTFSFKLDGNYLDVYLNNMYLITFINVDKKISDQYLNFVKGNSFSLENITWPRHADGTCDYEKKETLVAASSSQTNVSINKSMSVKENLKLRSAEATTSNVLTIMSAGTKVKIIELGKAETIDGINSNWVKVEIIFGNDKDGNKLKSGMTGWCYGGYLE